MKFSKPIPFLEAIDRLKERRIIPSDAGTAQWATLDVHLRERAFFSARVESARLLQSMHDYLGDYLAESRMPDGSLRAQGRAEFVANMRELAMREGLGRVDPLTGRVDPNIRESDLTDIRSLSRLQLIFDTQTESAQEFGYFQQGQDPDILDVFPAQRFIRVRPVIAPRPAHAANEGEVRRKDDLKFWVSMNEDFGVPWGPWGFNSGMGVEDVDRDEAVQLGVLSEADQVKPVKRDFNQGLQASTRDLESEILAALQRATGGTPAKGALTPAKGIPLQPDKNLNLQTAADLIASLKKSGSVKVSEKITISGASKSGVLTQSFLQSTLQDALDFLPPRIAGNLPKIQVVVKKGLQGALGSYSQQLKVLQLSSGSLTSSKEARKTILHEVIHWYHDHGGPEVEQAVQDLWNRRTAGETLKNLRPWNSSKIRGLRDKWLDSDGDEYAGRVYPWEKASPKGTEVLTRHLEKLSSPDDLARHWNHKSADGEYHWRSAFIELLNVIS